ncbi:MAG: peroxiredoxin [Gammaproteobacteria bacterium]|nr:peroxiredoxin [Gammaproteobacteria bacterium]
MTKAAIGKKMPAFSLESTAGALSNKDLAGKPTLLYFYPRDDTPGCTLEGREFTALHPKFKRAGIAVYGVSRDTLVKHERFKTKYAFPFDLIADPEEKLCEAFGVMKDKNLYGKKVRGIERSTFLFDADGALRAEWRKVKPEGHAEAMLKAAKDLD